MPRYVFEGSVGVVNQNKGGFPDPRFRFFDAKVSVSSPSTEERAACFFNNALRVVSFRVSPSSSSSESDESEPERLSSRSDYVLENHENGVHRNIPPTSFSKSPSDTGFAPLSLCFRL